MLWLIYSTQNKYTFRAAFLFVKKEPEVSGSVFGIVQCV